MKIQIKFKEYKKAGIKEAIAWVIIAGLILVVLGLLFKD